jgi:hypothetical protein
MKQLLVILLLSFLITSCNKIKTGVILIPDNEVPTWLKSDIEQQQNKILTSPKSTAPYGAWIRFNWNNDYYFEYHNYLSSSSPKAISFNRDTLHIIANDINTDYGKNKCCRTFVWRAPKYLE